MITILRTGCLSSFFADYNHDYDIQSTSAGSYVGNLKCSLGLILEFYPKIRDETDTVWNSDTNSHPNYNDFFFLTAASVSPWSPDW